MGGKRAYRHVQVNWNDPKEVDAYRKEYRVINADRIKVTKKRWQTENPEKVSVINKRYRDNNPDRIVVKRENDYEYVVRWKGMRKKIIIWHYSRGMMCCNYCGDTRQWALQIDHIMGDGSKQKKKHRTAILSFLIKNNLPMGYQILCANCNRSKHTMTDAEYLKRYPERVTNEHRLIQTY